MPTLKDVAREAGVTVTTVSRVLNNRGYISDETRDKVYQAMEKLDYQPNEIARSLSRKKSNIIGLIIPTVSHAFFGELSLYLENYAYELGYKVMLCNSRLESQKEQDYISMLRGHQVDGIVLASHTMDVEEFVGLDLPVVTLDREINDFPYVSSDNYHGGTLGTNLLINRGCRRLAYLGGNLQLDLLTNRRYQAFVNTAEGRDVEHVVMETDMNVFDTRQYQKLVYRTFDRLPGVDGIFASSDIIAANVIQVCQQLGKRVPEDVRVIGYDDLAIASLTVPQITTIRQPIEDMARMAVDLLDRQIEDKEVDTGNILPVTLVERETT